MRLLRGLHAVRSDELLALRERQITYMRSLIEEKDGQIEELQKRCEFYLRENEQAIYPMDLDEVIGEFEEMQELVRGTLAWLKRASASAEARSVAA